MKEDFFHKIKDYNNELEKILEKKDFSQDVKNLLLSMFYKLQISYDDYFLVKRNSETKQEYMEKVLENIKKSNKIQFVKLDDKEYQQLKDNGEYETDIKFKKIKVIENERALLSALLELNNFQIYLKEEYNLIRNSMPHLLNTAYEMESIEVIRDFNAWSWNTLVQEIKDVNINLVYQNLRIALNNNIFSEIQNSNIEDVIKKIKNSLLKKYDKETIEKFLELIFKISIIIYIKRSDNEAKRLLEEKQILEKDKEEINNKKMYVEKITLEKKKLTNEVKKLDLITNNRELLLEEYERRNALLPEYNKIFNLSHLIEKIQMQKERILMKIKNCNKKIEPKIYLEIRNKIHKDYELLCNIDFENNNANDVYPYIQQLQEIFIEEIFIKRIQEVSDRKDIIDCVYELRYYNFLPYNKEKNIKDVESLKTNLEKAKEILIKKLYDNKIINTLSTNEKVDIEIVKKIFDLKIIDMENIYIKIRRSNLDYIIEIYDEKETLESEFTIYFKLNSKDKIKLNRKIKLFKSER